MNRLEQDAADALQAHEDRRKAWGEAAKARYAKAMERATGPTLFYELTEQERTEREQQIEAGLIPF